MSARKRQDDGPVENWPVAQHSALAKTTEAVFIGDLPGRYAYAVVRHDGGIDLFGFPDRASLHRALAEAFTQRDAWKWPQSWDRVLTFGPDERVRLYMEVEEFPPVTAAELAKIAKDRRQQRARRRRFLKLVRKAAELAAKRAKESGS